MEKNRIKSIDSLRGIACLIVLIAHIISTNPNFGIYASGCGKIGVWCFMVLSGFLTFLPYASGKEVKLENKFTYVIEYYKRKLVKLYPAYIVALALALVLGFLADANSVINHLICVEGVGHFWYMPVIIKFYIIAPLFILLLGYLKEKLFVVLVSVLAMLACIIFPFTTYIENSINLYWYLPVFLIGCLLAYIYVRIKDTHSKILNVMSLISVICIFLLTPIMREIIWGMEPSGWLQNKYLIFAILWSVVILGILKNDKWSDTLSNCKLLQFMGKISFEVYLIHFLIMWKVVQYTNNTVIVAIVVSCVSIILATIVNKVISKSISLFQRNIFEIF